MVCHCVEPAIHIAWGWGDIEHSYVSGATANYNKYTGSVSALKLSVILFLMLGGT